MAYKLLVSKEALQDIDEIAVYIAHVLKNAQAAKGFLDDVERSYRTVTDNPLIYSLCADRRLQMEGYRKIPIKNYLIVYRVDEAEKTVFIVRIIYAARDYAKLL